MLNSILRDTAAWAIRALPDVRGRRRVAGLLRKVCESRHTDPVVVTPMRLGHYMKVDLRGLTEWCAFYTGDYDTEIVAALCSLFNDEWIVLDVGANVGFYAVPFARSLSGVSRAR